MEKKILKELKFLKIYSGVLTLALISIFIFSFVSNPEKQSFEEIDVERINVVEGNGDLKMVVSNQERQHPGMFDGEILVERERPPGIIFFNEEQDEVGGLIYQGNKKEGALMAFSVDQYKNDQVMQLRYLESDDQKRMYGLQLWDRDEDFTIPRLVKALDSLKQKDMSQKEIQKKLTEMNEGEPISARRLFVGKNLDHQVGLFIQDENGEDRIKIYVDEENKTQMEFLDKDGKIIPLSKLK